MVPLIIAVLAAYAFFLGWNGIHNQLPAIAVLGVGFALAAVAFFLRKPWSRWLVLVVCLLFVVAECSGIWLLFENTGSFLAPTRMLILLVLDLCKMAVAAIVPAFAFRTFRVKES
jgi:hypothetical protein